MNIYDSEKRDTILKGCSNNISRLCATLPVLDEYKKIVMVIMLREYIIIKTNKVTRLNAEQHYASNMEIPDAYEGEVKYSVTTLLRAYDDLQYNYWTDAQRISWNELWNGGHIEEVLKYEGFL